MTPLIDIYDEINNRANCCILSIVVENKVEATKAEATEAEDKASPQSLSSNLVSDDEEWMLLSEYEDDSEAESEIDMNGIFYIDMKWLEHQPTKDDAIAEMSYEDQVAQEFHNKFRVLDSLNEVEKKSGIKKLAEGLKFSTNDAEIESDPDLSHELPSKSNHAFANTTSILDLFFFFLANGVLGQSSLFVKFVPIPKGSKTTW